MRSTPYAFASAPSSCRTWCCSHATSAAAAADDADDDAEDDDDDDDDDDDADVEALTAAAESKSNERSVLFAAGVGASDVGNANTALLPFLKSVGGGDAAEIELGLRSSDGRE